MSVELKRLNVTIEEQTDLENSIAKSDRASALVDYLCMESGVETEEEKEETSHVE